MAQSEMTYFEEYVLPATVEAIGQKIDAFNAASNGSIVLTREGFDGNFKRDSFFASLAAAQRRVERYASPNASASETPLVNVAESTVKVAGGFGPIVFEPGQLSWLRVPTVAGVAVASEQLSDLILQDQLNTAIRALVAAISNVGAVSHDGTSDSSRQVAINAAHAKFGDRSGAIVANVMDGATYHNLIAEGLTNTNHLWQSGGVTVVDILGKRIVVTDCPSLYVSASPAHHFVLGLVAGAAVVHDEGDIIVNVQTTNGKERIESSFQADYTFGLGLKGYSWDEGNGGKSPSDAALGTGSNWDQTVTDVKHTAGVIAKVK